MSARPKRGGSSQSWLSFSGLLEVLIVLMCLGTLAGFFGRLWWLLELAAHFHLQLAIALVLSTLLLLALRRRRFAMFCGGFALVNTALVLSLFLPPKENVMSGGKPLKLVSLNVLTSNQRSDLVLDFLRTSAADVVFLMEVNDRWMNDLSVLNDSYPYRLVDPRTDNFGIALLSRLPLSRGQIIELGEAEIPSVVTDIEVAGQRVFLIGTHPLPPGTAENARLRNGQLQKIAGAVSGQTNAAIVIGDLNCTPWSPYYSELLTKGRLKNTSQGLGLFNSWPAGIHAVGIPIDHCLVSPAIGVINKEIGPSVGSDHLPVIIELNIPGS